MPIAGSPTHRPAATLVGRAGPNPANSSPMNSPTCYVTSPIRCAACWPAAAGWPLTCRRCGRRFGAAIWMVSRSG
jgi:hypothetical protein